MAEDRNKVTSAREFLVGRLSGETRSRLEDSFFTDDELFEQIEIAEDELVDGYVRHELSAADRHYFEQTLLRSPRIAERVRVAALLARASAATQPAVQPVSDRSVSQPARLPDWRTWLSPTSVFGKFAFAAFCLILVVGGGLLSLQYLRLREASKKLQDDRAALERRLQDLTTQSSQTSAERDKLNAELQRQQAENARLNEELERQLDRPVQSIATLGLTLFPGGSRGVNAGDSFRLQGTPARFQFNLLLEADDYRSYEAVVTTVSGRSIGQRSDLKSHASSSGKIVTFNLSSSRFSPGDYVVNLSGTTASGQAESIASYSFRVLPKAK